MAMFLGAFQNSAVFQDLFKLESVKTDHTLFSAHYRLSIGIIAFSFVSLGLAALEYGNLKCIFPGEPSNKDVTDWACWTVGLYTLNSEMEPGAPINIDSNERLPSRLHIRGIHNKSESVRYHNYYQWTPFILTGQIILFLVPRYLWRCCENGKIKMLCADGNLTQKILSDPTSGKQRLREIAEYFVSHVGYNNPYGFMFAICELLNFVVVVTQIYLLDAITGNVFFNYGFEAFYYVIEDVMDDRPDPFQYAFPIKAKCTFNQYGPGGNIIPHSGICSLPHNVINKVYLFYMCFYLLTLAIMDVGNIIVRVCIIGLPVARGLLLRNSACTTPPRVINQIISKCYYGDWFILQLLSINMDPPIFRELGAEILSQMQEAKHLV